MVSLSDTIPDVDEAYEDAFTVMYGQIFPYMMMKEIEMASRPMSIMNGYGTDSVNLIAGVLVNDSVDVIDNLSVTPFIEKGRVVRLDYRGAYPGLEGAMIELKEYMVDNNLQADGLNLV